MCGVLALLFILVPAAEIYVLLQVGNLLGALPTLGIIVATGLAGAALAKQQGTAAMRQVRQSLSEMKQIGMSLAEAALVLVAAVLMVTPGIMTDFVGLSLLLPPIRRVVARRIVGWAESRMDLDSVVIGGFNPNQGDEATGEHDPPPPGVIDV